MSKSLFVNPDINYSSYSNTTDYNKLLSELFTGCDLIDVPVVTIDFANDFYITFSVNTNGNIVVTFCYVLPMHFVNVPYKASNGLTITFGKDIFYSNLSSVNRGANLHLPLRPNPEGNIVLISQDFLFNANYLLQGFSEFVEFMTIQLNKDKQMLDLAKEEDKEMPVTETIPDNKFSNVYDEIFSKLIKAIDSYATVDIKYKAIKGKLIDGFLKLQEKLLRLFNSNFDLTVSEDLLYSINKKNLYLVLNTQKGIYFAYTDQQKFEANAMLPFLEFLEGLDPLQFFELVVIINAKFLNLISNLVVKLDEHSKNKFQNVVNLELELSDLYVMLSKLPELLKISYEHFE